MVKLRAYFTLERILIICAGFLLYLNTLSNDYAIDDSFVTQRPNITTQGLKAIPEILHSNYATDDTGLQYDYRPVVKVSFAIEHQFFGVHPGVSHFFNVIIYILCLLLVYRLMQLFVADASSRLPLLTTLLFAALPIHTEVVASIKNRDILLSFAFALQAAVVVMNGKQKERNPFLYYSIAAILLFLAFMSKLDALPFIAVIPVWVMLRFKTNYKIVAVSLLGLLLAYVLSRVTAKTVMPSLVERGYCYFENPLYYNKGLGFRIVAFFDTLGFYIVQFVFPFKQSCYYGANSVEILSLSAYGILGIITSALIVFGGILAWRKEKHLLLAGLFGLSACLSIFLNLVKPAVGIVADRFAFFGSLGFCISVIALTEPFLKNKKNKKLLIGAGTVLLIVFSSMILSRNSDWKSSPILVTADFKKYPESSYLNYLYATATMDSLVKYRSSIPLKVKLQKVSEIKKCLKRSIAISNDYPKAYKFLSSIMVFISKEYKEALPVINKGLTLQRIPDMYFYKGICFKELNQPDSAEISVKQALQFDPHMYNAYKFLLDQYNSKGNYEKSITLLNDALKKGIENELIYAGFTSTYYQMNDTISTLFYGEKVMEINPQNKEVKEMLSKFE